MALNLATLICPPAKSALTTRAIRDILKHSLFPLILAGKSRQRIQTFLSKPPIPLFLVCVSHPGYRLSISAMSPLRFKSGSGSVVDCCLPGLACSSVFEIKSDPRIGLKGLDARPGRISES